MWIHIPYTYCCLVAKSCLTLMLPHGLQSSRLRPQDFPGKNTGVVCHFVLLYRYRYRYTHIYILSRNSNLCISAYIEYMSFFLIICEQATIFPLCISERFPPGFWKQMLFTYSAYIHSSVSKAHQLRNLPWSWYFLFYLNVHFLEDWLDSLWTQSKESLRWHRLRA